MSKEENIGQKIIRLSRKIDRKMSKDVGQYGITNIQGKIINFVYKESSKREIFQKDIEERFNIRRSSVTSVINLMEENGLVERVNVAEDGRLKKIVLKDKGLELYSTVFQCIENMESLLSDALTDEERKLLFNLIDKLSENIAD